jgi:hypothetical protein
VEAKQRPQRSVIGWVTKIYYLKLRASEGTLSRWSRLYLQSLAPTPVSRKVDVRQAACRILSSRTYGYLDQSEQFYGLCYGFLVTKYILVYFFLIHRHPDPILTDTSMYTELRITHKYGSLTQNKFLMKVPLLRNNMTYIQNTHHF